MDWLERNRTREDFVLWVDMWDPHEPFDAPAFDIERYADPAFRGEQVILRGVEPAYRHVEADREQVAGLVVEQPEVH